MLDTLPDSVLICTKGSEEKIAKPIYGNLMLNSFFGCDVINAYEKKASLKKYKHEKEMPLKQRIFYDANAFEQQE